MSDLVRVRHKRGPRGSFWVSRGLYEKHRGDYVLVKLPPPQVESVEEETE